MAFLFNNMVIQTVTYFRIFQHDQIRTKITDINTKPMTPNKQVYASCTYRRFIVRFQFSIVYQFKL